MDTETKGALLTQEEPTYVRVLPDLDFPERFSAYVDMSNSDEPYNLTFFGYFNEKRGVYEVEELRASRRGADAMPVTSAGLRQVKVAEAVRDIYERKVLAAGRKWHRLAVPQDKPRADHEYLYLAREYVVARAFGDPPLKRIATLYGVSQSTATRYAARARELGYLEPADG